MTPAYTIINEDISDDKEPVLYIQRYKYPNRVYQVIRKTYDEGSEGKFIPNPIYQTKYWSVHFTLLEEYHFDPDEPDVTEVFAIIYRDEDNPPIDDPEGEREIGDPCLLITYSHSNKIYLCEYTGIYGDDIENYSEQDEKAFGEIAEPTLQTAIKKGVRLLDQLIKNSLLLQEDNPERL